jgi:NADH dehydrogenase
VAQQQARHAAGNLQRELRARPPKPITYKNPGLPATIGRNAAVARISGASFSGLPVWLAWVVVHIYRLIGFRNRLVLLLSWAWDFFCNDSQARLIAKE